VQDGSGDAEVAAWRDAAQKSAHECGRCENRVEASSPERAVVRGGRWRHGWRRAREWLGRGGAAAYADAGATWRRVRERTARTVLECKRWSAEAGLAQA
jgi:hypothetical protein